MFERFTDRARKVMALANQEAQRLNHGYIGTEHILLGLVKEGGGVGANVLKNLGVELRMVRKQVDSLIRHGAEEVATGKLPQTPRAKRVIECAIEEARRLGHNYVGTEHLLLGLLRETDGVAAHALQGLGLKLQDVREEVMNVLGAALEREPCESSSASVEEIKGSVPERFRSHPLVRRYESIIAALTHESENCAGKNDRLAGELRIELALLRDQLGRMINRLEGNPDFGVRIDA
jgi:ATP-dependent Clp protease ATP-binding subunit ClpA